jgi:hypothetical protein
MAQGTQQLTGQDAQKRGEDVRRKESVGGCDIELDREPFRDPSAEGCPYPITVFQALWFWLPKSQLRRQLAFSCPKPIVKRLFELYLQP